MMSDNEEEEGDVDDFVDEGDAYDLLHAPPLPAPLLGDAVDDDEDVDSDEDEEVLPPPTTPQNRKSYTIKKKREIMKRVK